MQYHRYINRGYNFRMPTPLVEAKRDEKKNLLVSAAAPVRGAVVRYTLDGAEPTPDSSELTGTVTVPPKKPFKTATFLGADRRSLTYTHFDDLSKYLKYGEVAGRWKSGKISANQPRVETFDATGLVDENGTYEITFVYERGRHKLVIESVEIVRNDVDSMGTDTHQGFATRRAKNNVYTIRVDGYETGASFKIKARVYGGGGHDSNGVVCIRKKDS